MEERLNELRLVIEKLGTHQNYSRTTRNVWEQRIRDMEATMTPPSQMLPHTRIKRGLLNFVGEIGATLFGTSTEEQVAQLKHHITKAQRTNRRIVHATNELISVVNQTRAEVSLNRQLLVAVEQFTKELYTELVTYRRVLDGFVGSLIALEESTQIYRILSALESVHNLWLRESDRYQRQRTSLELQARIKSGSGRWSVFAGSRLVLSTCIVSTSVGRDPTFGVYSPTASNGQNTVSSLPYPFVAGSC